MELAPPAAPVAPRRELTARALAFGCVAGALLSAGQVYVGLKTGFNDGGSIATALVAFGFFAAVRRFSPAAFGPLENNIAQTTAAAAAIMGFSAGLTSAFPALTMMGHDYPQWALPVWGSATGAIGVLVASQLRQKLVRRERLPFPTGAATGEVIAAIGSAREVAMRRATLLVGTAALAMAFAWFRDGRPALIPELLSVDVVVAGTSLSSLSVGLFPSPLMISTGMLIGQRAAFSLLAGAVVSWVILAPRLVQAGLVTAPTYVACNAWLVWPGVGLLLAGSLVPLALDWRGVARALRDVAVAMRRRAGVSEGQAAASEALPRWARAVLVTAVAAVFTLSIGVFHVGWLVALVGLVLSVVLANLCARTAGETDMAPVGSLAAVTQLALTGQGSMGSVVGGSVVLGAASQATQTLWAFKAGDRFDASPRAQLTAELVGCVVGSVVAVPAYAMIVRAYGIATVALPAPAALSWRATAEAVQHGFGALPPHAPMAALVAFGFGLVVVVLSRTRAARYLPSPAAMGIAMLTPFSISMSAAVGGLLLIVARRLSRSKDTEANIAAVAAGGIGGESIMAVIVAGLIATGFLVPR
jgi:OPT family oligopeptide transporter